jgi:hypothetical protein
LLIDAGAGGAGTGGAVSLDGGKGGAGTGGAVGLDGGTGGAGTGGSGPSDVAARDVSMVETEADGASGCGSAPPISYVDSCTGHTFYPDGTCVDGACATTPLEKRVFTEWRAQTKALSGLTDAELSDRVKIATVYYTDTGEGDGFVSIEYVVVLDWVRSRQTDAVGFADDAPNHPPTDAVLRQAVKLAIEEAEWTGLGAIEAVASEAEVRAAFDECACDIDIHVCDIDFENVSGRLTVPGLKAVDVASNECREAIVNVVTGKYQYCAATPCRIE